MVKSLFDPAVSAEVQQRIRALRPDSPRLWGKMTAAQALSHCATGFGMATGEFKPKRALMGYLIGGMVKRSLLEQGKPMIRNAPTMPALVVSDPRELATEQDRLCAAVQNFQAAGPAACTTHPHAFFGRLTGEEWGKLMYSHTDHHLRQFGA